MDVNKLVKDANKGDIGILGHVLMPKEKRGAVLEAHEKADFDENQNPDSE